MARKHFLVNYHTSTGTPSTNDVKYGEIVVRHGVNNPELMILKDDNEFATFIDKDAIDLMFTTVNGEINAVVAEVSALTDTVTKGFDDRYTKDEVNSHLTNAVASGKSYADAVEANASAYTDAQVLIVSGEVNTLVSEINGDISGLEDAFESISGAVTSIVITGTTEFNKTNETVTVSIVDNKATFDFSQMIIDCGEF